MASRTPARNRLAKPLPEQWRRWLVAQGVPRRKYTAVLRVMLSNGQVVDGVVVEEGWIVSVGLEALGRDSFEERIGFEPEHIVSAELLQVV